MNTLVDIARKTNTDTTTTAHKSPADTRQRYSLEAARIQRFYQAFLREQNFLAALAAGLLAALSSAIAWGLVTFITQLQLGVLALAMGPLVGLSVRRFGRGITTRYGVLGALLTLLGCLLGNWLAALATLARAQALPLIEALSPMTQNLSVLPELFWQSFHPIDSLFYLAAAYFAYQLSFRQITALELSALG
jgi:hypothetical protein